MILFVLGFVLAFWLYKKSCTPHCPYTFNQIPIGKYILHLHHWLLSLMALPFTQLPILKGLLSGSVAHGILMYNDWYSIIRKRPYPKVTDPLLTARDGHTTV